MADELCRLGVAIIEPEGIATLAEQLQETDREFEVAIDLQQAAQHGEIDSIPIPHWSLTSVELLGKKIAMLVRDLPSSSTRPWEEIVDELSSRLVAEEKR